jgi:hypothetical protein
MVGLSTAESDAGERPGDVRDNQEDDCARADVTV